jgi:LacI family purine nucleotide synthesis repressor
MKRNANIYEVAELAQVSAMTVTRAFSGKGSIAEKTRAKIMEAAEKLNYRPSLFARKLSGGSTNSIGILWSLAPPHSSVRQVRDISVRLYKRGYACHVADSLSDPKIITQCLEEFIDHRVDAVVVQASCSEIASPPFVSLLKRLPACLVIVNEPTPELPFDQLVINEQQAIRDALRHFAKAGKRNPAYFFSSLSRKKDAFLQEMEALGIAGGENNLLHITMSDSMNNRFNWGAYGEYLDKIYPDRIPFDAFLVSTDECAAALISHLKRRGLNVPEDIAVCGFNNSEMSEYFDPPIASVSRSENKVADLIEEMLMKRLANPSLKQQSHTLAMEFIPRASAGITKRR